MILQARHPRFLASVLTAMALLLSACATTRIQGTAEPPDSIHTAAPIPSGEGYYVSPFKADGSLATWVTTSKQNPHLNTDISGSRRLSAFLLPWADTSQTEKWRQQDAVASFGGWDKIRAGAQLSFNSVNDFRAHLLTFKGREGFSTGWYTATALYPEVGKCGFGKSC